MSLAIADDRGRPYDGRTTAVRPGTEDPMTDDAGPARELPTVDERAARGKEARARTPRSSHGDWSPDPGRADPIAILEQQATTRVPDLVPIRYGRMAASAFAFYRGGAAIMAADLAASGSSDLRVQLCGDAHLANFGGFASPERALLFDINDFDETHPGPFEWDLKRLAASIEIAARSRSFDRAVASGSVRRMGRSYRLAMRKFAAMTNLDVWYERLDASELAKLFSSEVTDETLRRLQRQVTKAQSKDRLKAMAKLTVEVDGRPQFVHDPPLVVPAHLIFDQMETEELHAMMRKLLSSYARTLSFNRRRLLETYEYVDIARKVVGVGSVGTRAWVVLLVGRDEHDPLFLQVKQAEASVLERYLGKSAFRTHGQRVVAGQSLMQAASDILLGWERVTGVDGVERDYYVRQLWDWKASADLEVMPPEVLGVYSEICGWTLARAHARSGDRVALASYLGRGDVLDRALSRFARAYADQNERDHAALVEAIESGRVVAQSGV
jgi:uncharacterized protein (DUF2252 family)